MKNVALLLVCSAAACVWCQFVIQSNLGKPHRWLLWILTISHQMYVLIAWWPACWQFQQKLNKQPFYFGFAQKGFRGSECPKCLQFVLLNHLDLPDWAITIKQLFGWLRFYFVVLQTQVTLFFVKVSKWWNEIRADSHLVWELVGLKPLIRVECWTPLVGWLSVTKIKIRFLFAAGTRHTLDTWLSSNILLLKWIQITIRENLREGFQILSLLLQRFANNSQRRKKRQLNRDVD